MTVRNLESLFHPSSVAVVGASKQPGTVGSVVMRNLLEAGFDGPIMPVNPKYQSVGGVLAYARVQDLPVAPDLGVICTPPPVVPEIVAGFGERGTRAVVVLTAGLSREQGPDGRPLDVAMGDAARAHRVRVLGPNCVGLLVPGSKLNASFAHAHARRGSLAFVSQSGALCTTVLDWANSAEIGFSHFVSLGDSSDVDFGDAIDWLGGDAKTSAILLYVESIKDPRKFVSAARAASRNKPIIAIKAGRVADGMRAAASHTGALAGADDVAAYALRRAGVLRVDDIDELFAAVETLARAPSLGGGRLAIVTNGGGAGVMATDAFVRGRGTLAELSEATIERLDRVLPFGWSRGNPVDIIGDAPADRFRSAVGIVAADPGVDALLVIQAPTAVVDRVEAAEAVIAAGRGTPKPVLTSWLGGGAATYARQRFATANIATYETPGAAVRAYLQLERYRAARNLLMQTPPSVAIERLDAGGRGRDLVARKIETGGGWLSQEDGSALLDAFGIPVVQARVVADASEAGTAAAELGFPVAIKVRSPDVLHKSDVGGVTLDLDSADAVRAAAEAMQSRVLSLIPDARLEGFVVQRMARRPGAYELLVGASVDPMFGPFVMFGQGGVAVEVIADRAVALPPLNATLARDLVEQTRVFKLLAGYRSRSAIDLDAVYRVLIRVSDMLAEVPEVVELDINPLLADEDGVVALDARVRLEPAKTARAQRFAIRPYPRELEEELVLANGRRVLARPIRPEDEPGHTELFRSFSPEDIRFRFFSLVRRMPHSQLARYTQIDYDREMAFIAVDQAASGKELGVVRLVAGADHDIAEFAIIVHPEIKGQGLGRLLLDKMIRYARDRGTRLMIGRVLPDNHRMLRLARSLGFEVLPDLEASGELEVRLVLR